MLFAVNNINRFFLTTHPEDFIIYLPNERHSRIVPVIETDDVSGIPLEVIVGRIGDKWYYVSSCPKCKSLEGYTETSNTAIRCKYCGHIVAQKAINRKTEKGK